MAQTELFISTPTTIQSDLSLVFPISFVILVACVKNNGVILESYCSFTPCVPPMHRILSLPSKYVPKLPTSYNHHSYRPCLRHYLTCLDCCEFPSPESYFLLNSQRTSFTNVSSLITLFKNTPWFPISDKVPYYPPPAYLSLTLFPINFLSLSLFWETLASLLGIVFCLKGSFTHCFLSLKNSSQESWRACFCTFFRAQLTYQKTIPEHLTLHLLHLHSLSYSTLFRTLFTTCHFI